MTVQQWGGVVSVQGKTSLAALAAQIADDKLLRDALMYAAAVPCLERMQQNLERHRRSSPSAVDSVGIVSLQTKPGQVAIVVGAIGDSALFGSDILREPRGDQDQGFILRYLEFGTAAHEVGKGKVHPGQPSQPWARPARDAVEPHIGSEVSAYLKSQIKALVARHRGGLR